jgi:lipopolysaccharide/colanic/teichoic acid biosynthesis glycosyltransferase
MDQGSHQKRDSEHLKEWEVLPQGTLGATLKRSLSRVSPRRRSHGRFLPKELFQERLFEEISRSDRSGRPFSIILIDTRLLGAGGLSQEEIAQLMCKRARSLRASDVMGWCNEGLVGVILPDSTEKQASAVVERVKNWLWELLKGGESRFSDLDGAVKILEYPTSLRAAIISCWGKRGDDPEKEPPPDPSGLKGCSVEWGFLSRRRARPLDRLAMRVLDIIGSSLGLVILAPLMVLIAIAIKMDSRGPVLFRQKRVGQYGKEFTMYKFRSMHHNCDEELHREYVGRLIENRAEQYQAGGQCLFKLACDPRVTRVGKFLRRTSLDELPQLINVLKGEMSLVGPRPPLPYEVEMYKSWHLRRILEAKPGITGLWQVCGRASTTFEEQVRLDLRYSERQSVLLYLWIILRTFKAVFEAKGAC